MRLYENEAKKIFKREGIPVPNHLGMICRPADLDSMELTFPLMLKALVLTGGRGKSGGIKKAANLTEARKSAVNIIGSTIGEYPVDMCMLEEAVQEKGACYLGITMDPATYHLIIMASASGGVDIEQVARKNPQEIFKKVMETNLKELPESAVTEIVRFLMKDMDENSVVEESMNKIVGSLYRLFQKYDCKVAEINPLLINTQGAIAADAKIVLDDNGLYRQGEMLDLLKISDVRHDVAEPTKNEIRARQAGFPYVDLLPENHVKDMNKLYVGLVPGGAGYGIFSIDEVANIGERFFDGRVIPVNFMDSGGGPSKEKVAEMFDLLMDYEAVDLIITSRFGGISSCDTFIRGLIQCLMERQQKGKRVLPVSGRMVGTDLSSAREYLSRAKAQHPEALDQLDMVVGNQVIMADIIKKGITRAFEMKGWTL